VTKARRLLWSCHITTNGGAWGERKYRSYSFSSSALDGGEWSASRPGCALAPGKESPVNGKKNNKGW
jgi:hypothetical protein